MQQGAAVAGIARMYGGHVGGVQRIGEHGDAHALPVQLAEHLDAGARGHEIRADQINFALGFAQSSLHAFGNIDPCPAVQCFGGVIANQFGGGADMGNEAQRGSVVVRIVGGGRVQAAFEPCQFGINIRTADDAF